MDKRKRVDLSLTIHLPDEHEADRVSVEKDGRVRVFDKTGKEIEPKQVVRAAHYERPEKDIKYQTLLTVDKGYASVGGLEELARLDHFIVIDTNNTEIDGTKVFAAFFIVCKLIAEKNGFRVVTLDDCAHVYEFHNVPGNPELLAILKIAHDTIQSRGIPPQDKIGFVTDTEINSHEAISKLETPIYAQQYLPNGFSLIYASADTGRELLNKLLRFCDKKSTKYLKRLEEGAFRKTGLACLEEDKSVFFRYTYYPGLEIINPVITGITTTPETKYTIQFNGDSDE